MSIRIRPILRPRRSRVPKVPVPFRSFQTIRDYEKGVKKVPRFPFYADKKAEKEDARLDDASIARSLKLNFEKDETLEDLLHTDQQRKLYVKKWTKILKKQAKERAELKETNQYSWITLEDRFIKNRVIFVTGDITQESSAKVMSIMQVLMTEDEFTKMVLFINSMGGEVQGGFAIYDWIQFMDCKVNTINLANCASTASLILAGGDIRLAFPHSTVLLHQPFASFFRDSELPNDMEHRVEAVAYYYHRIIMAYSTVTKWDPPKIIADLEEDYLMSATEAENHRIIDKLVTKNTDTDIYNPVLDKEDQPYTQGRADVAKWFVPKE